MSLKDIELENSISRISQLEAILSLTLLKQEHPRENVEEITELLKSASLSLFSESPSQIELDATSKLNKIKNRLFTEKIEKEKKFDFEIKTLALQSFLDDINGLNLNISDYLMSFGNSNVCYINKVWLNGSSEFKKENLNLKYVKIGDRSIERVGFTVANSFTYGIQMELKKCISYLDSDKKILHWENIISDLKSLSKSSGYTEGDVRLALMGFLRLGGLNQDLYSDMNINEIAQSLIDSVKPIHKTAILWNALRKLTRQVNTPLQLILAEAESYIRKIFPEPRQTKTRENYYFIALTSFINDRLSLEVVNEIKRKKELNMDYSYDHYKDMLIRLEQNESNIPTVILKYGRNSKHKNTIQEETLLNTALNNATSTVSIDYVSEDEDEFLLSGACYNRRQPTFSNNKLLHSLEQETLRQDIQTLGTCFGDRSEDDITTFIKFNNSFYAVPLKNCHVNMQLALIQAMKSGRTNQNITLSWDENENYMTKISKEQFDSAKMTGCKPSNRWAERREHTLRIALTTELNRANVHETRTTAQIHNIERPKSDSDSYDSTNDSIEEDSQKIELNNTNTANRDNRDGYHRNYDELYKPYYNKDKSPDNHYKNNYQTNNEDGLYRNTNIKNSYYKSSRSPYNDRRDNRTDQGNNPYYRNRPKSPNDYNNTYSNRDYNNYNNQRSSSQNRRDIPNGDYKSPDKYYTSTYQKYDRSPSNQFSGRSSSYSRNGPNQDGSRQRSRSGNTKSEQDSNRRTDNNSFDRNRQGTQSENRGRSQSNDRYGRNMTRRQDNTSYDRDRRRRQSSYSREDRSRSFERYRSADRGRSLERGRPLNSRYNRERSSDKTDSNDNRGRNSSRDRSLELRVRYPKFKPGDNCDENYNPSKVKLCRKCSLKGHFTHHEFECKKFTKFNDNPCKKCHNGFHFEKECSNTDIKTFNCESEEKNASLG